MTASFPSALVLSFLGLAVVSAAPAAEGEESRLVTTLHSQPSWVVRTDCVELAVTQLGAHMAPVTFFRQSDRPIQPYYISPWQDEGRPAGRVCPSRQDCLNHRLHIERRAVMGSCARSVTFGHHPSLFATPSGLETASCTLFRTFRSPGSYFASEKWRLSDA